MLVKDAMTWSPAEVVPGDSITTAARLMRTHGVGLLPVVESKLYRQLLGVVTDRDLVVRAMAEERASADHVRDVMTPAPVATIGPLDSVDRALAAMDAARVRRLPVVDEDEIVLGVISRVDIARLTASSVGAYIGHDL
ncbi:MAG TPA: CBS domain-containing protein [Gemmatimonadaceae bacterium]|nr:CBS domain-containing protein [Gemmatimonadaceae bacterium]